MMLDALVSFFASLLAGTGVGGGGLLVIYLSVFKGIGQLTSQGINLAFFLAGAAASVPIHLRRRKTDAAAVLVLGAMGAVGSYFGLKLASAVNPDILRMIFGVFLIFCGMKTLKSN